MEIYLNFVNSFWLDYILYFLKKLTEELTNGPPLWCIRYSSVFFLLNVYVREFLWKIIIIQMSFFVTILLNDCFVVFPLFCAVAKKWITNSGKSKTVNDWTQWSLYIDSCTYYFVKCQIGGWNEHLAISRKVIKSLESTAGCRTSNKPRTVWEK